MVIYTAGGLIHSNTNKFSNNNLNMLKILSRKNVGIEKRVLSSNLRLTTLNLQVETLKPHNVKLAN